MPNRRLFNLFAVAVGLSVGAPALAQGFPDRPIRLVVAAAAGGGTDTLARHLAHKWTERSGKPVVVENAGGGTGTIAGMKVLQSSSDGYTLLLTPIGGHVMAPVLVKNMPYQPETDFESVASFGAYSFLIVTHPSVPVNTVPELVAYARANPKKLNFGSSGTGSFSHVVGQMFQNAANVEFTHVPYKGNGQMVGDLLAGNVNLAFDGLLIMGPHVRAGKIKPLALMRPERDPKYPDIPTLTEQGYKGQDVTGWFGVFAPKGVPAPVLQYLRETVTSIVTSKEYTDILLNAGFELPPAAALKDFKAFTASETKRWTPILKQLAPSMD